MKQRTDAQIKHSLSITQNRHFSLCLVCKEKVFDKPAKRRMFCNKKCKGIYFKGWKHSEKSIDKISIKNTVHGMSKTRFYGVWKHIKSRTSDPKDPAYKNYGGRGILLSKEWEDFSNFKNDMYEKYVQHKLLNSGKRTEIDRIDNSQGYSKENCRWATREEQARNKRNTVTFNGLYTADISKKLGGSKSLVNGRLKLGWSKEMAFTTFNKRKNICK